MNLSYTELRQITDYWVNTYNDEDSTNVEYQESHKVFEDIRSYIINTPFHKLFFNEIKYQSIELINKIKNYFKPKTEEIETLDYL